KEMSEETRIAIRNVRRDVNKRIDKEEKEGLLSEDDADKTRKEVQDLTRDYEKKVDDLVTKKTQEIMKI
ncbi:MAG TPA: ribosome recycling factor, partial [Candidatus Hypogeohydataceae bacterium YC38]